MKKDKRTESGRLKDLPDLTFEQAMQKILHTPKSIVDKAMADRKKSEEKHTTKRGE